MSESAQSSSLSEYPSETSKTSSNVTHASEGEEQERDDGSSPIDMECNIQAERITKSLDKLVYQTKLAFCIPVLLKDDILTEILTSRHFEEVTYIYDQYENPLDSQSLMNMSAMEDMQAGDVSLKHRLNPDLGFMMYILGSYPALRPHVERITEKMKKDLIGTNAPNFKSYGKKTPVCLKYLLKLEEFRDLMVVQMKTKAAEEISAIIHTRKLEKSNNECLAKIAEDSKYLKEEKEAHDEDMRRKSELIANLRQELALSEHKALIKRKKQILDSERQMVLATRAHVVKYEMLKEEEVESRDLYNNTLHHSLAAEKSLRDRRRKCETQLQSWLQKYDVEMSAKQVDLDELIDQYNEEVENCKKLTIKLEEQNKEFEPLMAEREAEYHQEMTAKMEMFVIEHAARVIQTAWRDTLRNRAEKKKLMKLKRKMEAEREVAERKAELEAKKAAAIAKKQAAKEKAEAKAAAKQARLDAKAAKEAEEKEQGK